MKNLLHRLYCKIVRIYNGNLEIIQINKEPYMKIGKNSSSHCSLPFIVKKELQNNSRHFRFWKFNNLFGVICKKETIFINLNDFQKIALFYLTPAKGRGYIGLVAFPTQSSIGNGIELCYASPYSEQALQGFKQLTENVSKLIDKPIEVINCGADY